MRWWEVADIDVVAGGEVLGRMVDCAACCLGGECCQWQKGAMLEAIGSIDTTACESAEEWFLGVKAKVFVAI